MNTERGAVDLTRRIGSNSLVLFASYGLNTLLSGVVAVFLVRYLGREEYGLLSTTYAYVSFFLLFTSVGLDTVVQREASRTPERVGEIVEGILGLRLLLSGAAVLLSWALMFVIAPSPRLMGLIFLVSLSFLTSVHSLYLMPYVVRLQMGLPKLLLGLLAVLLSLAKLGLIAVGAPLEVFAAMELVSGLGSLGLAWGLGRRVGMAVKIRFHPEAWRRFLGDAWPIALSQTLIQVYLRIDHLMLYRLVGADEVGLYGASTRLVEFANVIPVVFMSSVFPILSQLHSSSESKLRMATAFSFRGMLWAGLPLGVFLFLWAGPVMEFLFGQEFSDAGPVLVLLAWSLPFTFVNSVLYNRLFASGDQRTAALLALVAAGVNIGLNLLLIPSRAGPGAAIATLVSYGLVVFLALGLRASRGVAVLAIRGAVRPVLGCAMTLAAVWYLEPGWLMALVAVPALFGLSLALLGEVGREEVRLLRRALGR